MMVRLVEHLRQAQQVRLYLHEFKPILVVVGSEEAVDSDKAMLKWHRMLHHNHSVPRARDFSESVVGNDVVDNDVVLVFQSCQVTWSKLASTLEILPGAQQGRSMLCFLDTHKSMVFFGPERTVMA